MKHTPFNDRSKVYCHGVHWFYDADADRVRPLMRKVDEKEYCPDCLPFVQEGMVVVSFSNGTELDCFHAGCFNCRHYIDDLENPQPGRLSPPFNACAWGVLDRIYLDMVEVERPRTRFHHPDDIDGSTCPPTCKRFTPKHDSDGEYRDPPPPDVPGQMLLGEDIAPVERVVGLTVSCASGRDAE